MTPITKKKKTGRIVGRRSGVSLMKHSGKTSFCCRFLLDWYTTLNNSSTLSVILIFIASYLVSWLVFAGMWMAVIQSYKKHHSLVCVGGIHDFVGALAYSFVTQTTIGFGSEQVHVECTGGIALLTIQIMIGIMIETTTFGLLFAKVSVPEKRRNTIMFSKRAVIYKKENGDHVLEFQVADLRSFPLPSCMVYLYLYIWRPDPRHGNQYTFEKHNLSVAETNKLLLLTPVTVTHVIDESSPLHGLTPALFQSMDLEIVAALEGSVQGTGLAGQYLWSYTQSEVLFDQQFVDTVCKREKGAWEISYQKLSETVPANAIE